jgi:uncharacterized protein with HEPN domain
MKQKPINFLNHILDETEFLLSVLAQMSREQFLQDGMAQRSCVRSLEIIGEATKNLPDDFRSANSEIEWSSLARLRDRLIHQYFGVDYEIVWEIMETKMPELNQALRILIENISTL